MQFYINIIITINIIIIIENIDGFMFEIVSACLGHTQFNYSTLNLVTLVPTSVDRVGYTQ